MSVWRPGLLLAAVCAVRQVERTLLAAGGNQVAQGQYGDEGEKQLASVASHTICPGEKTEV